MEKLHDERRVDLDLAKGLGILLVVLGHIVAREAPAGNAWYVVLKDAIYLFHMPFFMYLSGYVTFISGYADVDWRKWPGFVAKRAYRLLLPFLIFGLLIVAGKLVLGRYLSVDNLPVSATQALIDLIWTTDASPATSVWYIGVLFVLCIITPPLMKLLRQRLWLLLVLALVLYATPIPHLVYLDRVAKFYVFFVMGCLAASYRDAWLDLMDRHAWIWLGVFAVAVTATSAMGYKYFHYPVFLACGCLSIPALHALVRQPWLADSRVLMTLGVYSFIIYLLNTPFIGLVKGLGLKLLPWDGVNFLLYAPVLLLAGIIGPIVVKEYLFQRIPALYRLTS